MAYGWRGRCGLSFRLRVCTHSAHPGWSRIYGIVSPIHAFTCCSRSVVFVPLKGKAHRGHTASSSILLRAGKRISGSLEGPIER